MLASIKGRHSLSMTNLSTPFFCTDSIISQVKDSLRTVVGEKNSRKLEFISYYLLNLWQFTYDIYDFFLTL